MLYRIFWIPLPSTLYSTSSLPKTKFRKAWGFHGFLFTGLGHSDLTKHHASHESCRFSVRGAERLTGWKRRSKAGSFSMYLRYLRWKEMKSFKMWFLLIFICQAWETTWIHRSLRCSKIWILQESNSQFCTERTEGISSVCTLRFQFTRSTKMAFYYHMGHSSSVVAPIHCNSPRASAGFNRFALVGSA